VKNFTQHSTHPCLRPHLSAVGEDTEAPKQKLIGFVAYGLGFRPGLSGGGTKGSLPPTAGLHSTFDGLAQLSPNQAQWQPGRTKSMDDMRLYFDLRDKKYTLPDVHGVEVSDLDQARRVALTMLQKLRRKDPSVAQDWSGWRIDVVDAAGAVVLSIQLDSAESSACPSRSRKLQ